MPITPDDLAQRFAPPLTGGMLESRAAEFIFSTYQLAERACDVLPRGHHLDQAVVALESAAHWVYAGLSAVAADEASEVTDDSPVPYVLGGPAAPATGTAASLGAGLDLNVSMWRTGVRHGALPPLARLVALCLAEAAGEAGFIADVDQPSLEDLCLGTGLDVANLLHAVEELAITGWISRHTDAGATRYQLRMPVPSPNSR